LNYFIYGLLKKDLPLYIPFLEKPADPNDKAALLAGERNLWCTAVFTYFANRAIIEKDGAYYSIPDKLKAENQKRIQVFDFENVSVWAQPDGTIIYEKSSRASNIKRFTILGTKNYAKVMTVTTANLLQGL
jgi:hypothetical protein